MVDIRAFETLLEALNNEVENLPEGSSKSNLEDIHSELYSIYEDVAVADFDKTEEENELLKELLTPHLSWEDKVYLSIKYNLEF